MNVRVRLGIAGWRNRIVFHGVFLLLALATLALAITLLREEKARAYQRYAQSFPRALDALAARLRHPTGQLALLNPELGAQATPVLLPFSAIDFDDPQKARSAVEMSGCARQYANGASLCLAVGSNAYAGGFVYAVAALDAAPLLARERGQLDLADVHRLRVRLSYRNQTQTWLAPFEAMDAYGWQQRGRLTGFADIDAGSLPAKARPERDFRGWIWREGPCIGGEAVDCPRRTLFSLRLPVDALRDALMQRVTHAAVTWPPQDLARMELHIELLGPAGAVLFDSAAGQPQATITLQGLASELQTGEVLRIEHDGHLIAQVRGQAEPEDLPSPWLARLIRRLPLADPDPVLRAQDKVVTPLGRFDLTLTGDLRGVDRSLSAGAARVSWLVGSMLGAIGLAWLIIALGFMRRVARLTRRAAAVSQGIKPERADAELAQLDVSDLRGSDELGILAGTISDLLTRAKLALRREQLRAEHERDMWHAVGHEIMSPLQSLLALHDSDESRRYLERMQQAVRVLYGTASPSEALAAAPVNAQALDLAAFAAALAANARYAGLDDVQLAPWDGGPLMVQADEYALEDVLTHVLRNADRHRRTGTPIRLGLGREAGNAVLAVHNLGEPIAADLIDRIFDYGVSTTEPTEGQGRGQGLFVARTYLAKMDGSIAVANEASGVRFTIALPSLA